MPRDCKGLQSVDNLAREYLERVMAVQPLGPYVIVGCSVFGSLIASAMTSQLER